MLAAIIDTETTGLWQYGQSALSPAQPYPVAIALIAYDIDTQTVTYETGSLIDWGVDISPEAEAVHGISRQRCEDDGLLPDEAMGHMAKWMAAADLIVAHNADFDLRVIDCAIRRSGVTGAPDRWPQVVCTMRTTLDTLCLPFPTGKRGHKFPKLTEAYSFFFGAPPDDLHSALGDARATLAIFRECIARGITLRDDRHSPVALSV